MQALWFGENEKSYFSFEDLNVNRKVSKAFYPSYIAEHINDKKVNAKKEKGEIRVVSADIAVIGGSQNDATAIFCARLIPISNGYERQIVYAETFDGGTVQDQTMRINRLYHEFSADYIILDTQNFGTSIVDLLGEGQVDSETGMEYPPLKCMNDDRLAERCVYPHAEKVIYSFRGSPQLNSAIAKNMKASLRSKKLRLLIHENDAEEILINLKGYKSLPQDVKLKFKMPFIQTSLLINETINLESETSDIGIVKLKEVGNARKDRFSSVSYLNHFVTDYLEVKNRRKKEEISISKLFKFRQGKLY